MMFFLSAVLSPIIFGAGIISIPSIAFATDSCSQNGSTLTVVSDATNQVVEDNALAKPTWVHANWTNIVGSTWIWSTPEVLAPSASETKTFTKHFTVTGTVSGATLSLASDNEYKVWVNGTLVAQSLSSAQGYNFGSVTNITVASSLFVQGDNEIKMQVTNLALGGANTHTNPAGALYRLDVTMNSCTETPNATVVTTKIVCDKESDLPNWSGTGHAIDARTAQNYVTQKEGSCRIVPDWKFQWAPTSAENPGDNTGESASWHTFVSSTLIDVGHMSAVWIREVMNSDYIPFTGTSDTDTVSAEMYCNGDVLHYDNLDYARGLTNGSTVYCVAFNAKKTETPIVVDMCPNIPETQSTIPEGMMRDDASQCVPQTPVVDLCPNIEGTQDAIPEGMQISDGQCVSQTPTFDICPNIEGMQSTLPSGMTMTDGQCVVVENFDLCTNIAGVQSEIPSGTTAQGENQCVPIETRVVTSVGSDTFDYFGCTNSEAKNFNRLANKDDGSCELPKKEEPKGEVLGASTTEPDLSIPASCTEYLRDYMRIGKKNDIEQTKLLQSFLNEYMNAQIPVSGYFGSMTHSWVKKFQVKYHSEIIKPWLDAGFKDGDIENGTGYVFKTTKREINMLKCSTLNIPMPLLAPAQ